MVPQVSRFRVSELKHKIFGEAIEVALYCSVESFSFHVVELGQMAVEHDALSTDEVDTAFDDFDGYRQVLGRRFFVGHSWKG